MTDIRGRPRVQTSFEGEESLTVQSQGDQADINKILRRYRAVGVVDHLNQAEAMFKDVSEFTDLADAIGQARQAEAMFMQLPSKVREIFDHDVATWLDTAHDPEKRQALVDPVIIQDPAGAGPAGAPGAEGGGPAEAGPTPGEAEAPA